MLKVPLESPPENDLNTTFRPEGSTVSFRQDRFAPLKIGNVRRCHYIEHKYVINLGNLR